ncbi:hypothetical protein [Coprococcus comes]|uniref:hypothetical protein n=1 Tax=Coprococcus comes TaxID=410072 RepID=UPI00156FC09F|nr:hypothetical protein [Coprococcus comes]NSG33198.1 hypothetical protein [Coprococcus comes]
MKNASTLLKKYIKKGGAFYAYAVVTLATGEKLTLTSDRDFMISPNSYTEQGGSDGFPLGAAVSKTITLTIDNIDERYSKYDFYYARIALYTEAYNDYQTLRDINNDVIKDVENDPILTFDPHMERMQEGVFTVLNPVAIGDVIELTAYDDMWKSDRTFSTQLTYPTTALQLLQEVCTSCGMVLGSPTFRNSDFSISSAPGKTTGRKIIGYIAQLACGNAVIQNGMLTIKTHDFSAFSGITDSTKPESLKEDSGYHIFEDFASDPDIDTDNVVITGISTEVESKTGGDAETVISGTDDYCIKITNPLIKGKEQTVVNSIAEILVGATLRKFSGDFFPNPTVEFMDLACVVDRKDKVYRTIVTTHEFSYLGGSSFKCDINSPERQAGEYYSEAAEIYNGIKKDVASNKNNISNMQNAIELLNTTLENAAGMYESNAKQPDGSVVSFIHDKPTLAESKVVIKVTAEAIGLSNDGGKTYPYGIILTGDLIARILYTVGINADYIISGRISSKTGKVFFDLDNNVLSCNKIVSSEDGTSSDITSVIGASYVGGSTDTSGYKVHGLNTFHPGMSRYGIVIQPGNNDEIPTIITGGDSFSVKTRRDKDSDIRSGGIQLTKNGYMLLAGGCGDSLFNDSWIESNAYNSQYGNIIIQPRYTISGSTSISNGMVNINGPVNMHSSDVSISGRLTVSGSKNRAVDTESYGKRLLNCYETPSPMFGDVGDGITDNSGKCYINIDPIFLETIASGCKYQVFLQKNGEGDIWVEERCKTYFIVKGTANLKFSWEIKALQKEYEYERINQYSVEEDNIIDYGDIGAMMYQKYLEEMQVEV